MPRDANQLAHKIVQIATGQDTEPEPEAPIKNAAAVELGRKGGLKGGRARWKGVSKKKRSEIARKAVRARWAKSRKLPKSP
jgi:hypothetical protein